ncbi:hypothetical protein QCA50_015359 [Cerrena zonata]|uniref:Ubiquitin-like domain-containing protein n=1 Tax=Cerrena zonata TaxID=2478898 RepID=A0AAW0FLH6_9APHY
MLSEKAKGKQRAVEPEDAVVEPRPAKSLIIRFTEGVRDLTVTVHEQDTVRSVKQNIRNVRTEVKDRRLRLIHSGRLLTDSTNLYTLLSSVEDKQRSDSSSENTADTPGPPIWLHCSIGPQISANEEEDAKVQTAQLKPLRGFDRLAAAGFSEQDIANFRAQFHAHSSGDYLDQDFTSEDDLDEHARMLEEQWIESFDTGGGGALLHSSSTNYNVLKGIIIGFFFPLIPFYFFHQDKPAVFWEDGSEHQAMSSTMFSRRMQMGIVLGFAMNVLFGMWTYLLAS